MGSLKLAVIAVALHIALAAVGVPTKSANKCVVKSADVAFILDASGSVSNSQWKQSQDFAVNVVNGFDVGQDKVRVGLISFSTSTKLVFDFKRYNSKQDVITAIKRAPKESSSTYTYKALDQARTQLFQTNSGMRPGVPGILVVITDGVSQDSKKTIAAAKLLHARNITVFSVGVGKAKKEELNGMASKPQYVYTYTDFSKLISLQDIFQRETCKVAVKLATTRATTKAQMIPTKPAPVVGCTLTKSDIVFVVDTSSSVGIDNFNLTKVFLLSMMEKLDFSKTSVGIIKFNNDVKTEFNLNSNNNLASAKAAINAMVYDKGEATRISSALKHLREKSFILANGDRADAANLAILITDGKGKDPYRTQYEANLTKQANIELFSVGIGSDINTVELTAIASNPSFYYYVQNYNQLSTIQTRLAKKLCQGFTVPTTTPTTPAAPCICSDKESDCAGYGKDMCFDVSFRQFAKDRCPAYCDLCEPGCVRQLPPPKPCADKVPNCKSLVNVCTDQQYRGYAIGNCAKSCNLCTLLNPTPIIQTTTPTKPTTPTTTTPTTTPTTTTTPRPTKPTPFVPCDLNCYDERRDCDGYDKTLCSNVAYKGFFETNCKEYCGFCVPKATCITTPAPCADKLDCTGYGNDACVNFQQWAQDNCPRRCGLCPGQTPVTIGTVSPVCEDTIDCAPYGEDVCTDFPDFAAEKCRQFCGICVGTTTVAPCINKIDCSRFAKESCKLPDYRKYMIANCRLFCGLCGVKN